MPDRLTCSRINEEIHKLTLLRNGECQNDRAYLAMFLLLVVVTASAWAQTAATSGEVEKVFPQAHALYVDVHQNPELSGHETQTADKLVSRLRTLGYEVTEHVGGNGIVALLKNGPGPTVMLRTELDALPSRRRRVYLTPAGSTRKTTQVATSRSCMPAATTCTWHRSWELPRSWRIRRTPGMERSC